MDSSSLWQTTVAGPVGETPDVRLQPCTTALGISLKDPKKWKSSRIPQYVLFSESLSVAGVRVDEGEARTAGRHYRGLYICIYIYIEIYIEMYI